MRTCFSETHQKKRWPDSEGLFLCDLHDYFFSICRGTDPEAYRVASIIMNVSWGSPCAIKKVKHDLVKRIQRQNILMVGYLKEAVLMISLWQRGERYF